MTTINFLLLPSTRMTWAWTRTTRRGVVTVTLPCLLASTPSWTALFGPVTDEANLRVVRVLETEEGDPEMHFTVLVVERAWERRLPTRTRTRTLLPMVSGQPLGKDAAKRNRRQPVAKGFVHTVYKRETWLNEIEEGQELSGSYATKDEAVSAGRTRAKSDKTEHVIHNQDRQDRRPQPVWQRSPGWRLIGPGPLDAGRSARPSLTSRRVCRVRERAYCKEPQQQDPRSAASRLRSEQLRSELHMTARET
jgi:hypothetical protein